MEFIYEKKIEYGMCDTNAKLKVPEILKIVESGVASFFGIYHKDNVTLKKVYTAFWLFTKTCFQIDRLPCWDETVVIEACRVEQASRLTCIVEVYIHPKNASGIRAWVECCTASLETRKLLRLQAIDFAIPEVKPCPIAFNKWAIDCEEQRRMTVSSSYIDYSKHVNNAEYVRIIFDGYTIEELENMKVTFVEIHYLAEAKEGDMLSISRNSVDKATFFKITRDKPILEMMMKEE
ncbi:MAG: hypothetical protein K2J85_02095 [Anaeroplasmataceae bacterium]|nr:hypothetical protein [Anaeroplasmataceae bacterium]